MDNYQKMARAAKARFLTFDQDALIRKFSLPYDNSCLYPTLLGFRYRLSRATGDLERQVGDCWADGNSFDEVMTLLDLLCDSRQDRHLSGRWLGMQNFGHQFHRALLEPDRDPLAEKFDRNPDAFRRICTALGGKPLPQGDLGYAIPLFEELAIGVAFWYADEEFPAQLRFFWDENATMYLKYETMHYALGLLRRYLQDSGSVVQ